MSGLLILVGIVMIILNFMFGPKTAFFWLILCDIIFFLSSIGEITSGGGYTLFIFFLALHAPIFAYISWRYSIHQQEEINLKRQEESNKEQEETTYPLKTRETANDRRNS